MQACIYCSSIYNDMITYDICDQCWEALKIINSGMDADTKLKALMESGWKCITVDDKMRECNAKYDEIKYLKEKIDELKIKINTLRGTK